MNVVFESLFISVVAFAVGFSVAKLPSDPQPLPVPPACYDLAQSCDEALNICLDVADELESCMRETGWRPREERSL